MANLLRGRRSAWPVMIGLAAVGVLVAACGASTPTASPAPPSAAGPVAVDVNLEEWAISPSVATVAAGEVQFTAHNLGPDDEHEMVVIRTDLGLLNLPTGADGKVDEEAAGLATVGEIEEMAVGATGTITLDLAAGRYLLICNIVDAEGDAHYGKGMTTEFIVN